MVIQLAVVGLTSTIIHNLQKMACNIGELYFSAIYISRLCQTQDDCKTPEEAGLVTWKLKFLGFCLIACGVLPISFLWEALTKVCKNKQSL